ncbi:MAG: radical SAM protein [Desulfobacterales bacterium]|nr:radical SAM protein [Desulfobacterales bacterium]
MMKDAPHILLINPWIHDFAAYDFWAKPLGLLTLAALLRCHGLSVSYIDCLDRFHPQAAYSDPSARWGRGPYLKTPIHKPHGLDDVQRRFCRYGIKPGWLAQDLKGVPLPDLILVTSLMTYWYGGVQETIAMLRDIFPQTAIILGGIYASLCSDHARQHTGADEIIAGAAENALFDIVARYTGFKVTARFDPQNLDTYPYPAYDLQNRINYVPLLTSRGCPFKCTYCAAHFLSPARLWRSPASVLEEIKFWHHTRAIRDFVLYDDAFLVEPQQHAVPLLEKIIQADLDLRFHTPNAVHIRGLTAQTAQLLFRAGFQTLRLGLETTDFQTRADMDRKVTQDDFKRAASFLKAAGFTKDQVGAYLLMGLPQQELNAVRRSIQMVLAAGINPILAYYSPIPHTAMWPAALSASRYDLAADPVFTNNSILPCRSEAFNWKTISALKELASGSKTQ